MWRSIVTAFVVTLVVALLLPLPATAQTSTAGIQLKAVVETGGRVHLAWTMSSRDTVREYSIFRAPGNDTARLALLATVTGTSYVDAPPMAAHASVYAYYVTAVTTRGVTIRSNLVIVTVGSMGTRDFVVITSKPNEYAEVGKEYRYKVEAKSTVASATFRYALTVAPAGMTIDSTGLVKWVPGERGFASVEIRVTSSGGGQAIQRYTIRVSVGSGVVEGAVTDTVGKPIARAMITLFRSDRSLFYDYKAVTDEQGRYKVEHVESGDYYVRAEHPDYLPEWYDGAASLDKATKVTVVQNGTTTVNFSLASRIRPILTQFVIEGTVVDTVRRAPIRGALVVFVDAEFALNSSRRVSDDVSMMANMRAHFDLDALLDHRIDGSSRFVFKTHTDSLGRYALRVPPGKYIASAQARGYVRIFFEQKTNLLQADVIVVSADVKINFALPPLPQVALGEINGAVIDSVTGSGVKARVIAFRDRWTKVDLWPVGRHYFTDTDSTGKYSFQDVLPGEYIIMAVPMGSYPPSYYNHEGKVTFRWKDASKVAVNGNVVAGINIYVKSMARTASGYTYISGQVTTSAQISGKVGVLGAAGVSGAIVYATDTKGTMVGYGVTDETGTYVIAGMAPGTYTVFADNPGYTSTQSATASPTYTATGSPQPASSNLTMSPTGTTSVGDDPIVPTGYVLEQNYPNPFNPTTQIVFSIPQPDRVSLVIYNILGQKVATLIDRELDAGTMRVTWNGRDDAGNALPSGIYIYKLTTSNFNAARKMTLLK